VENPPDAIENIHPALEGRQTKSVAPPGLGIDVSSLPVVTLRSTTG